MQLNQRQQQAVTYIDSPCLVLAGAGSGKTRVIINKIAYLIEKHNFAPENIAAVTFTNKAAGEMKERIAKTIGARLSEAVTISTFHALGFNIIKHEYKKLNLKSSITLFDEYDQLSLLKELTVDLFKADNAILRQIVTTISNWKANLITPEQAKKQAVNQEQASFASIYHNYNQQIKAYNVLDFDDLIMLPTLLLQQDPQVLSYWQNKIKYLLVDEYQDTNNSQYELTKLLVGNNGGFTAVGDDDQSIYSWRGAQPQNMLRLQTDFPNLRLIKLEQNYRSTKLILNSANALIANNPHTFGKTLFSDLADGEKISVIEAKNEEDEAEQVVSGLITHKFLHKTKYNEYAILYRGNYQAKQLENALIKNRVPYKITGGTSFFAQAEIKDMLAYLRLLVNQDDDMAFLRIVNTPKRSIGTATLSQLGLLAKDKHCSLFEAIFDFGLMDRITKSSYVALNNFANQIIKFATQAKIAPMPAINEMFNDIHYTKFLLEKNQAAKVSNQLKNIEHLFSLVQSMLQMPLDDSIADLSAVVNRLMLRDMLEKNDETIDQVNLMTLHAAKGLEFPYVYLIGMEEGILPHQNSINEGNIAEERRLAYVGITRAQTKLTFSHCKERKYLRDTVRCVPSRFLLEIPKENLLSASEFNLDEDQKTNQAINHLVNLRAMLQKK